MSPYSRREASLTFGTGTRPIQSRKTGPGTSGTGIAVRQPPAGPKTRGKLCSQMLRFVRDWWTAGEDGAVEVCRKPFALALLFVVGSIALFCSYRPSLRQPAMWPVYAWLVSRVVAEGRRALVATGTHLVYRPPFGKPVALRFDQVRRVEEAKAPLSFGFKIRVVKGIKLDLGTGTDVVLPLDIPGAWDMVRGRLKAASPPFS